jgi:aspartyl aminopeptidase
MEQKNTWLSYTAAQKRELEKISKEYMDFLSEGKTERECADIAVNEAEKAGYRNLHDIIKSKKKIKAGDKVYAVCMGKTIALFNIGKDDIEDGMSILGAHIDSPRLDIKQSPLYEEA